MKKFILLIACSLCIMSSRAQIQSAQIHCDTILDVTDTVMDNMFSSWHAKYFIPFLKKWGIKDFDCDGCKGVRARLQFHIDKDGKFVPYKMLGEVKCGKPFGLEFRDEFYQTFEKLVFPEQFRNKCYVRVFGGLLKC